MKKQNRLTRQDIDLLCKGLELLPIEMRAQRDSQRIFKKLYENPFFDSLIDKSKVSPHQVEPETDFQVRMKKLYTAMIAVKEKLTVMALQDDIETTNFSTCYLVSLN